MPAMLAEERDAVTRVDGLEHLRARMIHATPTNAIVTNQIVITGPNSLPTRSVPCC